MLKHASLSPHDLIDGSTPREVFRRHDVACAPCRELFSLARRHGDHELLNAWRTQLATHLANEAERRDFDRLVVQRLAAYRRALREKDEQTVTAPVSSPGHPGEFGPARFAGSGGAR